MKLERTARTTLVALLGLASSACKDKTSPPAAPADAAVAPGSDAAPADAAPADAAQSAAATALDDLLHFTDARIGVSSKVDNPHDFAEHVADGRLDTAWNGKTGDLVGGWIGFRVPSAARVKLVELTVGYAAKSKKGEDLFTMNHRIARVRVTRDGVSLGEHALDPDERGFQRIALDAPGGDFKLEVLAVKPGTRREWKELVVSELRVFGIAGTAKKATASIPHVSVGSFDAPPPAAAVPAPAPAMATKTAAASIALETPEEECRTWLVPQKSAYDELLDGGTIANVPWEPPAPSCTFDVSVSRGDVKLVIFRRSDLEKSWAEVATVQGKRTFVVESLDEQSHFDPHCSGYSGESVHNARIEPSEEIVFSIYRFSVREQEILAAAGVRRRLLAG